VTWHGIGVRRIWHRTFDRWGTPTIDGACLRGTHGEGGGTFANDYRDRRVNATFVPTDTARTSHVHRTGFVRVSRVWLRASKPIAAGSEIFVSGFERKASVHRVAEQSIATTMLCILGQAFIEQEQ